MSLQNISSNNAENPNRLPSLNQITIGLQALSSGTINELYELRNELEISERKLVQVTNQDLEKMAEDQAEAVKQSTELDASSKKKSAIGGIIGGGLGAAASGAGEYQASKSNADISEANTRVESLSNEITAKKQEIASINLGLGDAPANGVVGDPPELVQAKADLADLQAQHKTALGDVQHHENQRSQAIQRFNVGGQAIGNGIKSGFDISAASDINDKAQQDANQALFSYSQQVLGKLIDNLNQMAGSQASEVKDIGQTLDSIRSAGTYRG